MEIKQGSELITIFIKPRRSGIVIDLAAFVAPYQVGPFTPGPGQFFLNASTADKTDMLVIESPTQSPDEMIFVLPNEMFEVAQRTWTVILKFVLGGTTDFALYNFDIKVTKGDSVNSR